ncbi:hypothetical protein HPP92_015596 [Vanilla planifolia]|uniref:Uncharacterized protein n=1 Tax=Vanilla planifolia TaxID=51239 RepID=A0A835US69_VANPL|nr:hypothetical protein HPP92_015596 [Vanilla planifolia]
MLKPIKQSDVKRLSCHMKSFKRPSLGRLSIRTSAGPPDADPPGQPPDPPAVASPPDP